MTMVVYLGPSVPLAEARKHLDARFLPPCAMGDVYAAVRRDKPSAIGIIDGYFERTPAVWHKEILFALSLGIPVFGASSMGALRAAELAAFGMRGVGRIHAAFASGALEDDDEVALTHASAEQDYAPHSEAMVNLRYGLSLARDAGMLSAGEEQALAEEQKALFYPDRSWAAMWSGDAVRALGEDRASVLRTFIEFRRPDLKCEDGLALLDAMRDWQRNPAAEARPDLEFEPTIFWEHLCSSRDVATSGEGGEVANERLIDHIRLADGDDSALVDQALFLHLLELEATRRRLPSPDDRSALARFRRDRGLTSAAALEAWMKKEQVDPAQCLGLARSEALRRTLRWRCAEPINRRLPQALKREGRFGATVAAVTSKWRLLASAGLSQPTQADVESIDEVLAWYQMVHGPVTVPLDQHITERGFGSGRQFTAELVASYLAANMSGMADAAE